MTKVDYDVIIVGAGPAGLSAGLYTSRMSLKTLIVEKNVACSQLYETMHVENYLGGYSHSANELASRMEEDALRFGAELIDFTSVKSIKKVNDHYEVILQDESFYDERLVTSYAVLMATGTKHNHLTIDNHDELLGKGISYCAVCDAPFYQNGNVFVVGGGDSAYESALLIAQYAKQVNLVIRNVPRAKPHLQEQVEQIDNINVLLHSEIIGLTGHDKLQQVIIKSKDGLREEQADGLFVCIGASPDVNYIEHGYLTDILNVDGYIVPTNWQLQANTSGLFLAGDISNPKHRQIAIAVGEGAKAGLEIYEYVTARKKGL